MEDGQKNSRRHDHPARPAARAAGARPVALLFAFTPEDRVTIAYFVVIVTGVLLGLVIHHLNETSIQNDKRFAMRLESGVSEAAEPENLVEPQKVVLELSELKALAPAASPEMPLSAA
jgi:hypothetical protein